MTSLLRRLGATITTSAYTATSGHHAALARVQRLSLTAALLILAVALPVDSKPWGLVAAVLIVVSLLVDVLLDLADLGRPDESEAGS